MSMFDVMRQGREKLSLITSSQALEVWSWGNFISWHRRGIVHFEVQVAKNIPADTSRAGTAGMGDRIFYF